MFSGKIYNGIVFVIAMFYRGSPIIHFQSSQNISPKPLSAIPIAANHSQPLPITKPVISPSPASPQPNPVTAFSISQPSYSYIIA